MNTAHEPEWFEIRLQQHLDQRWASWFDGMTIEPQADGSTLLRGHVADQAALHGLLARLRDLGLPLVSVAAVPVPPPQAIKKGNQP
ncbi:hypothetical protein [Ornithinimicrobium cryptoxanthini]|uniref:BON domain-containing protein n=1 Tax=Ornithinimicrobium cryptoxanthini TaxID=2934161 RepID=A0ABY4YKW5_9MICO|nr:hypothetical protein [Ornithinimicrobium cryptoxanthini]USQ77348.1 hypothetical protein NF557_05395 [Ornithinimicrobium cryptoxanthini]